MSEFLGHFCHGLTVAYATAAILDRITCKHCPSRCRKIFGRRQGSGSKAPDSCGFLLSCSQYLWFSLGLGFCLSSWLWLWLCFGLGFGSPFRGFRSWSGFLGSFCLRGGWGLPCSSGGSPSMGFRAGHRFICKCAAEDGYYETGLSCKAKKVPSLKGVVECCNAFEVVTAEARATNPCAL